MRKMTELPEMILGQGRCSTS